MRPSQRSGAHGASDAGMASRTTFEVVSERMPKSDVEWTSSSGSADLNVHGLVASCSAAAESSLGPCEWSQGWLCAHANGRPDVLTRSSSRRVRRGEVVARGQVMTAGSAGMDAATSAC